MQIVVCNGVEFMKFTYDEIVKATSATVLQCASTAGNLTVSTDSRNINDGNFYIPLKGESVRE